MTGGHTCELEGGNWQGSILRTAGLGLRPLWRWTQASMVVFWEEREPSRPRIGIPGLRSNWMTCFQSCLPTIHLGCSVAS